MQIPESNSGRERPEGSGSQDGSPAARGESGPTVDPPTIVRGSSSTSRRVPVLGRATVSIPLPQPGQVIDTFVLEEAIGAGGMGAVFRAHDAKLDRQVALKLLPPDQTDDPEVVQRFYQEGRSAAQLDHENIARVYSLGQDGIYHYIVFEYIEGVTIRRKVDDVGPLPLNEAVDVTLQISEALVHATNRGVVHRDIKPSNIILTPQGRAKLVDMGLARRFERQTDVGLTQTGMTLGTFDYISPEQARDPRDVDVRSDLYSLGCTLFHMLSGQPPFPGGTVLQKLLQHQEEPPPDVRALNPAVPADLARVLTKLMAKDRDRRYQSPEQLVRDLLTVAGQSGLTLSHVDAPAWMSKPRRPSWERHLVFLVPTAGFVLLAAGLLWWGRELADSTSSSPLGEFGATAPPRPQALNAAARIVPDPADRPAGVDAAARSIGVRSADDLASVIASAPRKSVVTLTDDGPYLLGGRIGGARANPTLLNRDVTIRAESGKRPVLKFAADARGADQPAPALLAFAGGRVALKGLIIEVESEPPAGRAAAILVEDAELKLEGCTFRRDDGLEAATVGLPAVLGRVLRAGSADGGRPPFIFADQCHFDPGAVAFECEGPADLRFSDCTFGPGGTSIWLNNGRAAAPPACDVLIQRSSFMTGPAPVFQIDGSLATFRVDDSVIAPGAVGGALGSLIQVDTPRNLDWSGRSNLYGKLNAFLTVAGQEDAAENVRDFEHWRENQSEQREVKSVPARSLVWESSDPAQDLAYGVDNPTRAFQLAPVSSQSGRRGASRGPFGATLVDSTSPRPDAAAKETIAAQPAFEPAKTVPNAPESSKVVGPPLKLDADTPLAPMPMPMPIPTTPTTTVAARTNEATGIPAMPPMTTTPTDDPVEPATAASSREPEVAVTTPKAPLANAGEPKPTETDQASGRATTNRTVNSDEDVIRSAEQFVNVLARHGTKGGVLRIAAGADLELSPVEFNGGAEWRIEAEAGGHRPRIRFRPPLFAARTASNWTTLLNVQGGKLHLQGLDVLVQDADPEAMSRIAAVGLVAGASLTLTDCTVTLSGPASSLAVVAVLPSRTSNDALPTDSNKPAVVRIHDSFLRSIGDGFTVASDRRLDCELRNVLVATDGSLLHALGCTQATRQTPSLTLKLDRVSAMAKGGLVHLESSPDEPELHLAEVQAENSVLSTGSAAGPLFRVDGRESMESLRDRIRWTGDNVGYHQITAYRRDEVAQTGVRPRIYDRTDWNNFVRKDESPVLEVQFLNKLPPTESAGSMSKDDLRLSPQSPLYRKGSDLQRIPEAPGVET
ncbi:MAG: serine/threonine-protein kinase [Paludisphaera borealis]|uniref:serine/threonine-protein kinase n=1 Tax=Paludisphaera borealis TaxID=1387353 RepID=UPI00284EE86A|nr:serine/threonine-protein kinase [Paludisphaera borealis]MDR3622319.1 serine/threonine-protein kinase [Paludisphaera borealis]